MTVGALASGCATQRPASVSESRAVEYQQDATHIRSAYVLAAEELGWEVEDQTEESVTVASASSTANHQLRFDRGDTLTTLVRITSRYSPFDLDEYARVRQLLAGVSAVLENGDGDEFAYPLAIYPEGARNCDGPVHLGVEGRTVPVLHGGIGSVMMRLRYPAEARAGGVQGRVLVSFVVDESGRVECAMVQDGLPGGLSEEAIRAILPSVFDPAAIDGEPVRMRMSFPVTFSLP